MNRKQQFVLPDWFGDEILSAAFHGIHGIFHRAEGRDEDDHRLRPKPLHLRQNIEAATARKLQISNNQVTIAVVDFSQAAFGVIM